MTQAPGTNVVEVKPAPTVYTVLILIALLALIASIGIAGHRLMASPANGAGYGLTVGEIFKPWDEIQPKADTGRLAPGRGPRRARR